MSEQEREARRSRLAALRAAGIDPFPARVGPREPIADVWDRFGALDAEALESDPPRVRVAGRVVASRSFGKLIFLRLLESGSAIQVSAKKAQLEPELFTLIRNLDVGDFVWIEGAVWRTRTGELTIDASAARLLAKSLRGLPEKWHGLSDVETRYRQRYLDLLVNEDARRIALVRSRTITAMRAFLDARGYIEVQTPILQPLYGGAAARPFTSHHRGFDQDLYLRISDELYLKRLVVGGLDRVYEIGHDFRNEGVSRKHNPEFTMMECYEAYADYRDMMDLLEAMVREITIAVHGTTQIEFQGEKIDFAAPWTRISISDAIRDETGVDVLEHADLETLRAAVIERGLEVGDTPTWATLVDNLFSEHVEPKSNRYSARAWA